MSWLYSQALVAEYLADISLDGEQSAPLSGNPTQQAYCAPDKMTAFSRLSRFGMTYKPLMESHGQALLMSYLEAFRAKTSQLRGGGQDLMAKGQECGEKWHGLLARFDQDSHLWRTVQCSLLEDLNESLQTLPQWGMTVGGELYLLPTLVQNINVKESGLWLTPSTVDIPTRSVESMEKRLDYRKKIGRNGVGAGCLSEQVTWSQNGPPVGYLTKMWPTPVKSDYAARRPSKGWQGNSDLPSVVWTETGGRENPQMSPAQLNATWVEWLMGWPLGWTDLKRLETDKSHCVPQQHGKYSVKEFND